MAKSAALAGVKGIEHVGLVVPDVEEAARFFGDLLGGRKLYDIGPFDEPQDWMAHHLARRPGVRIHRMRVMAIANGPVLELIELTAPIEMESGWHVAFYVDDMDAAVAGLKSNGVEILSGPVQMTEGPSAGLEWLYFKTPWGQQLELVSYPGGVSAYRAAGFEVWGKG